jgi:hypothetical protein
MSSLNPKRGVKKETPKPREEAFVCMFCGCAGHLDEFCFHHKRIEKMPFDYARYSYRDEFIDFLPHSYSRVLPRTSHALSHFSQGHNHCSCGFYSSENSLVPRHFGYGPRPHRRDHFSARPNIPTGGSFTHFQAKHLDGPHFPHCGSHPTSSKAKVQKAVKTSSGRMLKC